jgi:hypothetical protein
MRYLQSFISVVVCLMLFGCGGKSSSTPNDPAALFPSPDGQWVAVLRQVDVNHLKLSLRRATETKETVVVPGDWGYVSFVTWAPDSSQVGWKFGDTSIQRCFTKDAVIRTVLNAAPSGTGVASIISWNTDDFIYFYAGAGAVVKVKSDGSVVEHVSGPPVYIEPNTK